MSAASDDEGHASYEERVRPASARFLRDARRPIPTPRRPCSCEIIGAGPRAAARRDAILDAFAESLPPRQPARRAALRRAHVRLARRRLRRSSARSSSSPRAACAPARPPTSVALEPVIDAADAGRARARVTAPERRAASLARLEQEVVACRRCPRLVAWREQVAREKRASFADRGVLGPPGPGLRRPGRARARPRPGARRPRRQPHRPRVHRRPLGRLALRRHAPQRASPTSRPRCTRDDGLRLPGRVDRGGRALRAAGQQADAPGARRLPALDGGGARAPQRPQGRSSASARSPGTPRCACAPRSAIRARAAAALRPRRRSSTTARG